MASFLAKFMKLTLSYLHGIIKEQNNQSDAEDSRLSAAAKLPVPYMCVYLESKMIKKKLPVMSLGEFRARIEVASEDVSCAICLNSIGEIEEIRLIGNCSHLFHRECIDGWMEHGTCPLCRLKLLPVEKEQGKFDPWREERIVYLFGEDYVNLNF
ncbi:RING/U-box superfamily protein [Euphorbia peplus]|nr:RING/U-box superfamily protein [Euphorbia peplus]